MFVTFRPHSVLNRFGTEQIQTVSTTVFAITAGGLVAYYRWYKVILIVGLCIRLLGLGCKSDLGGILPSAQRLVEYRPDYSVLAVMIHSRGANGNTAELVWSQLLQGWGECFVIDSHRQRIPLTC